MPQIIGSIPFWDGSDGAAWATNGLQLGSPWMTVTIGAWSFTGYVRGSHGPKEWVRAGTSSSGSENTSRGRRSSDVRVELWLLTPFDLSSYAAMIPWLYRMKSINRGVVVDHPSTRIPTGAPLSFSFSRAEFLEAPKGGGLAKNTLHFLEWLPIALAAAPAATQDSAQPPDPFAVVNAQLLALGRAAMLGQSTVSAPPTPISAPAPVPPSEIDNQPNFVNALLHGPQ